MKLQLEDGREVEVGFRKLRVGEFKQAYEAVRQGDEIKLVAMTMVPEDPNSPMPLTLVHQLSQAAYNLAAVTMRAENRDFFATCIRLSIDAMTTDARALSRTAAELSAARFGSTGERTSPNSQSPLG